MVRHGSKSRFKRHWSNKSSELAKNECPIFYQALRDSNISDWFVFTLKVCPKKYLKKWETKLTKEYKTSDPEFGYNYFVGDNKPDNNTHMETFQSAKANGNVKRAINGALRKKTHSKDLPPNINYRLSKKKDGTVCGEGYFVQIKINGKLYNKAFLSMAESMKSKLERAKKQLELFKLDAKKINNAGSKTNKTNSGGKTNKK